MKVSTICCICWYDNDIVQIIYATIWRNWKPLWFIHTSAANWIWINLRTHTHNILSAINTEQLCMCRRKLIHVCMCVERQCQCVRCFDISDELLPLSLTLSVYTVEKWQQKSHQLGRSKYTWIELVKETNKTKRITKYFRSIIYQLNEREEKKSIDCDWMKTLVWIINYGTFNGGGIVSKGNWFTSYHRMQVNWNGN